MQGHFDSHLLSRIEDAGLNASAPPQQRWMDGWLVRLSPGKAKRARCVNAVAEGQRPAADKLARCDVAYAQAGLPFFVRVTPFTQPAGLDRWLEEQGWARIDDTRVMVLPLLAADASGDETGLPPGSRLLPLDAGAFAEVVGALRGSPLPQRLAHAQRLRASPVVHSGWAVMVGDVVVACGQFAIEDDLVGLYDVFTAPSFRGQGWASGLCSALLKQARAQGARTAYLQVDADNAAARAIYHRLGFADAYAYHYRCRDPHAA